MRNGLRGSHSSSRSFGRFGIVSRQRFLPKDLKLPVFIAREEFESLLDKSQTGSVALCSLKEETAAAVEILLPTLKNHSLSQEVVHGIDCLEEKRTLHELIAPDAVPENEKVLPVELTVITSLEEEKRLRDILHHLAECNVFDGILRRATKSTARFLLEPPGSSPTVPPSGEESKCDSRRNGLVCRLEDGYRSAGHRQFATFHLPPAESCDEPRLCGREEFVHQSNHRPLDSIPGRSCSTTRTLGSLDDVLFADPPLSVLVLRLEDGLDDAM